MASSDQSPKSKSLEKQKDYKFEVLFKFSINDGEGDLDIEVDNIAANHEMVATFLHMLTTGELNNTLGDMVSADNERQDQSFIDCTIIRLAELKRQTISAPIIRAEEVFGQ